MCARGHFLVTIKEPEHDVFRKKSKRKRPCSPRSFRAGRVRAFENCLTNQAQGEHRGEVRSPHMDLGEPRSGRHCPTRLMSPWHSHSASPNIGDFRISRQFPKPRRSLTVELRWSRPLFRRCVCPLLGQAHVFLRATCSSWVSTRMRHRMWSNSHALRNLSTRGQHSHCGSRDLGALGGDLHSHDWPLVGISSRPEVILFCRIRITIEGAVAATTYSNKNKIYSTKAHHRRRTLDRRFEHTSKSLEQIAPEQCLSNCRSPAARRGQNMTAVGSSSGQLRPYLVQPRPKLPISSQIWPKSAAGRLFECQHRWSSMECVLGWWSTPAVSSGCELRGPLRRLIAAALVLFVGTRSGSVEVTIIVDRQMWPPELTAGELAARPPPPRAPACSETRTSGLPSWPSELTAGPDRRS